MRKKVQNIQVFIIDNEIKYSETREMGKGQYAESVEIN